MSYQSIPFFYRGPLGTPMYHPKGPVECFVVRANLFGSDLLGRRGAYHSGILFRADDREWAFELVLSDFAALVPDIVNGHVSAEPFITLGYYAPLDAHLWRSYWSYTSARVCTLSPAQYEATVSQILTVIAPTYDKYVVFGIAAVPTVRRNGRHEQQTDLNYTEDAVCDKLPKHTFEFLAKKGIRCGPFPIMRSVLQTPTPPVKLATDDPGLLAYAREMQRLKRVFAEIKGQDLHAVIDIYMAFKTDRIAPFRYVMSIEPTTHAVSYYLLPSNDVAVSVTDVSFHVNESAAPVGHRGHGAQAGHSGAHLDSAAPIPALSAAIVATTLDPMDYLTNSRGATRPNSLLANSVCMAQRTTGIAPAQHASICASMSANSLYQNSQLDTVGFFQPPWVNDLAGGGAAGAAIAVGPDPAREPADEVDSTTGLTAMAESWAGAADFGTMLPQSTGPALPTQYQARDWYVSGMSKGPSEAPYSDGSEDVLASGAASMMARSAEPAGLAALGGLSPVEPGSYGPMVGTERRDIVTEQSALRF